MVGEWFTGVVEDRFDPLKQGRIRVRVFAYHTDQKSKNAQQGIPTEELLWMHPMSSITSASMSGIGQTPLGAVEGTHVVGFFRDAFKQDGVVIGTLGGTYVEKPNPAKGFSDPSGQYPRYIGNDLNVLAGGGQPGSGSSGSGAIVGEDNRPISVDIQDDNTTLAVAPTDVPLEDIAEDDNPDFTIEKMLRQDEGYRLQWYADSLGYPTIGIGHLLIHQVTRDLNVINAAISAQVGRVCTNGTITNAEVSELFARDLAQVRADIARISSLREVYVTLNRSRQMSMENMCFQMGAGGLAKFKNTLAKMKAKDWKGAYDGLRDSLWARQTPGRSSRVARIVLTGNLESYGVKAPDNPIEKPEPLKLKSMDEKPEPLKLKSMAMASEPVSIASQMASQYDRAPMKMATVQRVLSRSARAADPEPSPEDPYVPEDTRIAFEEPKSSYAARYPYNHVYESESGHIVEFDDTPGAERYHRKHPSGTYEEISPDGRRVTKIVGDDFLIVQSGRNLNVKGDMNIVVEGNATLYYMGNCIQTVDGNLTQFVRGNVTETVEGNVNSKVTGNVTETVNGNVTSTVKGNVSQDVTGDYKLKAANITMETAGKFNATASGDAKVHGANATLDATGTAQVSGATINLN